MVLYICLKEFKCCLVNVIQYIHHKSSVDFSSFFPPKRQEPMNYVILWNKQKNQVVTDSSFDWEEAVALSRN